MENSIEQYRMAIGVFFGGGRRPKEKLGLSRAYGIEEGSYKRSTMHFLLIVVGILLISSGVETNPGPQCKVEVSMNSPAPAPEFDIDLVLSLLDLLRWGQIAVEEKNVR